MCVCVCVCVCLCVCVQVIVRMLACVIYILDYMYLNYIGFYF